MVFDLEGIAVGHLSTGFAVAFTAAAAEEALRDGLAYTLRLPIRGLVATRFVSPSAIRAQESMGSAGEFVNVDDMAGGAFALSGIVLRGDAGAPAGSGEADRDRTHACAIHPALSARHPTVLCLRDLQREHGGRGRREHPARDRKSVRDAADTLALPPGNDRRFAAAGGLRLGEQLPPGSYALVVSATTPDPNRKGRSRTAVQQIGFDVR